MQERLIDFPILSNRLQEHRRQVGMLTHFYRYLNGSFSSEEKHAIRVPICTRLTLITGCFFDSILSSSALLWKGLPAGVSSLMQGSLQGSCHSFLSLKILLTASDKPLLAYRSCETLWQWHSQLGMLWVWKVWRGDYLFNFNGINIPQTIIFSLFLPGIFITKMHNLKKKYIHIIYHNAFKFSSSCVLKDPT